MNLRKKARQFAAAAGGRKFRHQLRAVNVGRRRGDSQAPGGVRRWYLPVPGQLDPRLFAKTLSASELAIGAAVLLPFVPAGVAGAALTVFSAGLIGLYLRTPGMRREGSLRPTEQGIPLAKDVWLAAIGASLMIDDLVNRRRS
jgi:hypothetical protein